MSAHKKTLVTVDQEEFKKLHEAEMKLRFMQKDIPEVISTVSQNTARKMWTHLDELQNRQSEFIQLISGIDEDLAIIEGETCKKLIQNQAEITEWMNIAIEDQSQSTLQMIQKYNQILEEKFSDRINQEEIKRTEEIEKRIRLLESIATEESLDFQNWMKIVDDLSRYIKNHYPSRFLDQNTLTRAEFIFTLARDNYSKGLLDVALSQIQEVYVEITHARNKAEAEQTSWQNLIMLCLNKLMVVKESIKKQRYLPAIDLQGQEMTVILDTDYWTHGKLHRLHSRVINLINALNKDNNFYNHEQLVRIIKNEIPIFENELNEITFTARLNAIKSELRANIMNLMVRALNDQGYMVREFGYDMNDPRHLAIAKLMHFDGSEITLRIDPDEVSDKQSVDLFTFDPFHRNDRELIQRANEIYSTLAEYGVNAEPFEVITNDNRVNEIFSNEKELRTKFSYQ